MFQTEGASVCLSPAGPADAARISDFVAGLSMRTQFRRFFASVARPSSGLMRALTGADGRADVLVATDADGTVIGHAMAVDQTLADGARVADVGLVVADAWQGHGVGSALLGTLADRAAGRGAGEFVMDVLPANDPMLALIGRRWPGARRESRPDSVRFRAPLGPPATQASPAIQAGPATGGIPATPLIPGTPTTPAGPAARPAAARAA